ncbi:hypothetical protein ABZP36_014247 [Zizania latifolia]
MVGRGGVLGVIKEAAVQAAMEGMEITSGPQNVVTAADQGGATHVDIGIACDQDLVKLALHLTSLPFNLCLLRRSFSVPFSSAVEAGAKMNYMCDKFQILKLTKETRKMLPDIILFLMVPHTLSLPDQMILAELLEEEGADIIKTEGGKCSNSISRSVSIPLMCASGLSSVTAGAAGVGIGSAVNRLNDGVAMIAEVRSIAQSLGLS